GGGEAGGVGMLRAGVVRAEEKVRAERGARAVAEAGLRGGSVPAQRGRRAEDRVPGDLAEGDDDPQARECRELADEEGAAALELVGRRLVGWRRAARGERDEDVAHREAVVAVHR